MVITTNIGKTFKNTLYTTHTLLIISTYLACSHSGIFPALALSVSAGSLSSARLESRQTKTKN